MSRRQPAAQLAVPEPTNVFGADPHKRTVTASVLDARGGVLGTATFPVSGDGHRAMESWALQFGPISRWGIEGASGLGRHTAMFLISRGRDVRDVCPNRTAEQARHRRTGKTDALDAVRVARATQADPAMPTAFKRAAGDVGPDETHELMSLWHKARRSILTSRQHLINEAEHLLGELPEPLRAGLPDTPDVRSRLRVLARRAEQQWDPATALRLELLDRHQATIADLDAQDRHAATELRQLAERAGSTLHDLCGIAERIEAELLVEVGDPRRFTGEGGFARFNGTAPLPASSAEGDGQPVRHRLNRGGNRQANAALYRVVIIRMRSHPPTLDYVRRRTAEGKGKMEIIRCLKRFVAREIFGYLCRASRPHTKVAPTS